MESADGDVATEVIVVTEVEAETAPDAEVAEADGSVSEGVEGVARAAGLVALRGADVIAARRQPDVRRAALDLGSLAIVVAAALTAFAFANWAAASALTTAVSDWLAALILMTIWIAVAVLLAAFLLRGDRSLLSYRKRFLAKDAVETLPARQDALEEAEQELRVQLDALAEAIGAAAQERISAAILPLAGGVVEVGEEMVDATDEVLEAADEITDAIEEKVPGGVVVNRAFDVVLVPGRFGIRAARTVFKLGPNKR
jgi:type IV secretory pathway TrbD component